ncbi:Small glutamine-rich tetratricopeptide repeat-containing protein beta [Porphyridium purpureum]|uniref:Small glutamine-rich tetratricopeptide repeat-containing protein beta n=1 Tax=Porphyridium purpureum TaxID=35688 RepID=A0A5J4YJW8_PORPP|nr:Small glutamine-rich tetratricopeptide repeat-containing protein beta [Porphyridium purpureum]|eukprot:POR9237..scf261_15
MTAIGRIGCSLNRRATMAKNNKASSASSAIDRKSIANDLKDQGNALMTKGDHQQALKLYTRAIHEDESNPVLYTNRAAAYFSAKKYADSLKDAEKAIALDAKWWKAYKRKAMALCHLKRFDDAIAAFEAGLAIAKDEEDLTKGLEFAKACLEQSQHLYVLPKQNMMARLDGVPCFYVADAQGQPFFVTYEDGQQICTFYFEYSEAQSTLEWIQQQNPGLADAANIVPVSLSQALFLAQDTQSNQYVEELQAIMLGGSFPLAFQFRPELKQVEFAIERLKSMPPEETEGEKSEDAQPEEELTVENFNGIPVFQAKGLTLLQDNNQYVPLFLARHDLESSWEQLQEMGIGEIPPTCEIDVGTLEDVLKRMAQSTTGEFDSIIFVPNSHMRQHVKDDFPMDELTKSQKNPQPFQAAKAIKMAGGSTEDVRKAVVKELAKNTDKTKYMEVLLRHNIPVSVASKDAPTPKEVNAPN